MGGVVFLEFNIFNIRVFIFFDFICVNRIFFIKGIMYYFSLSNILYNLSKKKIVIFNRIMYMNCFFLGFY